MRLGKFLQLRQPRRRAVFVHDLADHTGGIKTGDAGNVNARFGLALTHEYSAFFCTQGKDVSGSCEILRPGLWINGNLNRRGAIRNRDAGGHALASIDGDDESSSQKGSVVGDLRGEVQFVTTFLSQRQAN